MLIGSVLPFLFKTRQFHIRIAHKPQNNLSNAVNRTLEDILKPEMKHVNIIPDFL